MSNKSTYQFKHWLKVKDFSFVDFPSKPFSSKIIFIFIHHTQMSQVGLTESVRGDPRRFEVWLNGRAEVHTFQAATVEIKGKWVSEIKKVLFNQLEELKDEKIKQYGNANHR